MAARLRGAASSGRLRRPWPRAAHECLRSCRRDVNGATNPTNAAPGSIRGDLALDIGRNVVHCSDSVATAQREVKLYFQEQELVAWQRTGERWVHEKA
ncbi:MAG: nucleoside-diphosphate kinase [bacterium]